MRRMAASMKSTGKELESSTDAEPGAESATQGSVVYDASQVCSRIGTHELGKVGNMN